MTVIASQDGTAPNLEEHPSARVLRVLSDLASLFTSPPSGNAESPAQPKKAKPNHVVHKLTFYAAYVLGTPGPMLRVLADEAAMRAKTLESEAREAGRRRDGKDVKRVGRGNESGPRIEEL